MIKKTAIVLLALGAAMPAFAAQTNPDASHPSAKVASPPQAAAVTAASAPTVLRVAQPERKTADDYAPLARSVYFGGR
jgi:hypothetical protein